VAKDVVFLKKNLLAFKKVVFRIFANFV